MLPAPNVSIYAINNSTLAAMQSTFHNALMRRRTLRHKTANLKHAAAKDVDPALIANVDPLKFWVHSLHRGLVDRFDLQSALRFHARKLRLSRRTYWSNVTGPVTALLATCQRVGWNLKNAAEIVWRDGTKWNMTQRSLNDITDRARNDVDDWTWEMAQQIEARPAQLLGGVRQRGPCQHHASSEGEDSQGRPAGGWLLGIVMHGRATHAGAGVPNWHNRLR